MIKRRENGSLLRGKWRAFSLIIHEVPPLSIRTVFLGYLQLDLLYKEYHRSNRNRNAICNRFHTCIVLTVNNTYHTLPMKGNETCQN